jgi:uncharacterized protein YkwD
MRFSKKFSLALALLLLCGLLALPAGVSQLTQAEPFASPAFQKVWAQTDQAVKQGQESRTWFWGPEPGVALQEAYAESPGGLRQIQYFDKSRMEINNPKADPNSAYFVTNGLLARELVSGRMQTGDNRYEQRDPSNESVGGDPGNPGPTYATFTNLASLNNDKRTPEKSGFITDKIDRAGNISPTTASANLANYAYYSPELGHNIPDVFYGTFFQWQALGIDWVYVLGLPITEPYWATFTVGGVQKELLVQIYERRALTFTPNNPPGYLVEMGNIGQHYYRWRYPNNTGPTPTGTHTIAPSTTATTTAAATTPATTTTAPTTPAATTAAPTTVASNAALDSEELQFLNLINQYRAQNGKAALKTSDKLVSASKWLSNDMATKNYLNHTDSLGRAFNVRLNAFGFNAIDMGENIAAGYTTAPQVIEGWKSSPDHNANMLGDKYELIGIGRAYNPSSTYGWYWTTDFGSSK